MTCFHTARTSFDETAHDHNACIELALRAAEGLCQARGVRLTPLRRRVLELVWGSHRPVGAYDLLQQLSVEHGRAAPPTVYRALDFLLEQGLIHRIESLNAFIGCAHPEVSHNGHVLICRECGSAAEIHDPRIERALQQGTSELGFRIESETVELSGLCARCQGEPRHEGRSDGR